VLRIIEIREGIVIQTSDDGFVWKTLDSHETISKGRWGYIPITYKTKEEAEIALQKLSNSLV